MASWTAANYCDTDVLEKLYAGCIENIDRIEAAEFSVQEFREKYDEANKPCIIQGCLDDKWDFEKNWSWQVSLPYLLRLSMTGTKTPL